MALFRGGQDKVNKTEAIRGILDQRWDDREELSKALQQLASIRSIEPGDLIPLLTRNDPTIRAFAEVQIGRKLDSRTLDQLMKRIGSMTTRTQSLVLHTILRTKPNISLPVVRKLVESGENDALGNLALDAMASLPGHRVGKEFLSFLAHEKADVRHMALVKISESDALKEQASIMSRLLAMIDDEEQRIRLRVLDLVEEVEPSEAVRISLSRLRDESPQVQQKAVRSLSAALERLESSEGAAEEQLFGLLTDGSEAVRGGVVDILMKRPDRDRLLRKLLLFCKGVMGWVRERTLDSLRRHAEDLTGPVIALMDDEDEDVRTMALLLGATLEAPEAVPHIAKLLRDDDWWLRMIAAETLGKIGDVRAVAPLMGALDDVECGQAAIEALASIGDKRATSAIARQLSRAEVEVRVEAIEALRRIRDERVVPVLEQCAERDPVAAVRKRADEVATELSGGMGKRDSRQFRIPEEHREDTLDKLNRVEILLVETREREGSDLHLLVGSAPTVRIHGRLQRLNEPALSDEMVRGLLFPILDDKQRAVLERDKQLDLCHAIPQAGRYRCNVYEESKGLAASFRVIPQIVPTLDDIGLPAHLGDLVNYHQGLIVVAGPSGSGKSTTLAALVNLFNEQKRCHILSLEDPIEFVHPAKGALVTQRQIDRHTESFAAALRGALRQDPDVIVVGQMRDPETVRLAIEASETGHLVIGTMNTTSAPKTVDRIVDSFPVSEQSQIRTMLSETLKAVIAQQLLPSDDAEEGRVACFEVMMGTRDIRLLIRDNKTFQIPGQMQIGERWGHLTVDKALARLLEAGRISADQAYARAQNKELFEAKLGTHHLRGNTEAEAVAE